MSSGPERGRGLLGFAVLIAAIAILGALLEDYYLYIGAQVLIFAVVAMGLDIVYGRTGQLTLAHASFFGIGAYSTAIMADMAIPAWIQPPLVTVLALAAGAMLALPTLRLSGLRLAVVTLLFGELFRWWVIRFSGVTGGSQGKVVTPLEIGPFYSAEPLHGYILAAVLAVLATALTGAIGRAQLGRRMLAVRDSEIAAVSLGIPIVRTKVTAFMISAAYAGVAGWVFAYVVGFLSPVNFDLFASVYVLVAVILGGPGTLAGPWLGAAFIVLLPEAFSAADHANLFPILGGAVMIFVALLLPDGIAGTLHRLQRGGGRSR